MKSVVATIFLVLVLIEIYSIFPPKGGLPVRDPAWPYLQGIIHVHSQFSHDAGGLIPDLVDAAKQTQTDFVVLTDHNTTEARRMGLEKSYDGMDLFVEIEATTQAGHLVGFFSHTPARQIGDGELVQLLWKHFLEKDSLPGIFLSIAHPSSIRRPWTRLDRYADGLEIFSFDSVWQRALDDSAPDFALTFALIPFNRFLAALRAFRFYPKDLLAWDAMNAVAPGHFGILGHDTHERLILTNKIKPRWPDYLATFKLASNLVLRPSPLPADFEERKKAIYESIHKGQVAIAFRLLYPPQGSDWYLECPGKPVERSGSETAFSPACHFKVSLPPGFPYQSQIRLMRNGDPHREIVTSESSVNIPLDLPGTYRLEVWVPLHTAGRILLNQNVPYLVYNPIYVK